MVIAQLLIVRNPPIHPHNAFVAPASSVNWAVEKMNLRFDEFPTENTQGLFLSYGKSVIGSAQLKRNDDSEWTLSLSVDEAYLKDEFIKNSLVRVSLLMAQLRNSNGEKQISFDPAHRGTFVANLVAMGFRPRGTHLIYDFQTISNETLSILKRYLREYIKAAPKVGRGFLVDVTNLSSEALALLNEEYHEVAWGITNWARQSSIGADELEIISDYAKGTSGVEIGAGSGRVTSHLYDRFSQLTATDIVASALGHIEKNKSPDSGSKTSLLVDDILNTKLAPNNFDVVMFWENGLGAFLSKEERRKAVENMSQILKPGGRLILGVRNLLPIPVDQLMVAAQTDLVMGIYHTFTREEVEGLMPNYMKLVVAREGLERPAGGRQLFLIFEKERAL